MIVTRGIIRRVRNTVAGVKRSLFASGQASVTNVRRTAMGVDSTPLASQANTQTSKRVYKPISR
ncbi:MAG: hypothetical protein FVQ80_08435 [Planctomycetes bacterium]|nr:hypothetical protein [Planctomycetota bacterium]